MMGTGSGFGTQMLLSLPVAVTVFAYNAQRAKWRFPLICKVVGFSEGNLLHKNQVV